MKFLHTSDWHLGMTFRGGISYREDQEYVISRICDIAVEEKVDGILLAGDVFDKSIASQEALKVYDSVMTHICGRLRIPVYMVAGNHDGAERISQCSELLKKSGLYIAGALEKEAQVVNLGEVDIYLLPWISTDKVKGIYPEEAEKIETMEDAYRVVLDKYREHFVQGRKNLLVAHAYTADAETSTSDRAAEVGHATMVGAGVFEGFDYVALGHLHGPQQVRENIRYSGTPMAYSFGKEESQSKSVTIIDTDKMEQRIIPVPQLRGRTTLKGTYAELMTNDYADEILEGYVRLEVTDCYVGLDTMASLRERFARLLEVTGKDLERDDGRITMTIDELEEAETDPGFIFCRYCKDILGEEPREHLMALFDKAIESFEKGAVEE